jgi:predicted peroxiredoxin
MSMSRPLVVKVTCGSDEPERSNQGLTVAATALSAGAEVSLWLTGEGSWLGVAGRTAFELPFAAPG